ncbi:MAG TPA: hypothetical protein VK646_09700 [Actinomycetota bacterium]|nr:hypothetical protein [Actinomycetota bacterium]
MGRRWVSGAIVATCLVVLGTVVAIGTSRHPVTMPAPVSEPFPAHVRLDAASSSGGQTLAGGCRPEAAGGVAPFVTLNIPSVVRTGFGALAIATGINQQASWIANAGLRCGPASRGFATAVRIIVQPTFSMTANPGACSGWASSAPELECGPDGSLTLTPRTLRVDCHRAGGTVHTCSSWASNVSLSIPAGARIETFCASAIATFVMANGSERQVSGSACT